MIRFLGLLAVLEISSSANASLFETQSDEEILSEENVVSVLNDEEFTMATAQQINEDELKHDTDRNDANPLVDSEQRCKFSLRNFTTDFLLCKMESFLCLMFFV